jgi:acetyltransferase-like isoleucine patch superfamily enzyme
MTLEARTAGDRSRLSIHETAIVNDAFFNVISGTVTIGEYSFFGNGVFILTGSHDVTKFGLARQRSFPQEGRDIVIGDGVWIASNATVLGPCVIGDHAVVAAGALVQNDVAAYTIVAGVPAKIIGDVRGRSR